MTNYNEKRRHAGGHDGVEKNKDKRDELLIAREDGAVNDLPDNVLDRPFKVSVADSAKARDWSNVESFDNWAAFANRLTQHEEGDKDGSCFIPGTFVHGRRGTEHVEELSFVVLDVDCGHDQNDIVVSLEFANLAGVVISTHSHMSNVKPVPEKAWHQYEKLHKNTTLESFLTDRYGVLPKIAKGADWDGEPYDVDQGNGLVPTRDIRHQPCPRFRVIIPLSAPVKRSDFASTEEFSEYWARRVEALAYKLDIKVDSCSKRPAQLYYFPRHPGGGASPEAYVNQGIALDLAALPDAPDRDSPAALRQEFEKGVKDKKKVGGVIGVFNESYTAREILQEYGYVPDGNRFLYPCSSTGVAGVVVLDDGKIYSHHTGDPLADGHAHDAFDIYRIMGHDGDFKAALVGAGEMIRESVVDKVNQRHALVIIGGKPYVIDEEKRHRGFEPLTMPGFHALYENILIPVQKKSGPSVVTASKYWMGHRTRRVVGGVDFAPPPSILEQGWYNLFQGYALVPARKSNDGAWLLYREHVEKVVCGGNPELINYFWAWVAHMIQKPGAAKPGVAIALRGGRGTGKGTTTAPLLRLTAPHSIQINNRERLTGRFNSHLADKILVVADEAHWSGDKKAEGALKGLITEPTLDVEAKGRDSIAVRNFTRLMLTSNEGWVVPAGMDERRYLVLDVPNTYSQDQDYFGAIHKQMENGGDAALLRFLQDVDLSAVNLRKAPHTAALVDQKLASLGSAETFWFECLKEGHLPRILGFGAEYDEVEDRWPDFVVTETLFGLYLAETQKIKRRPESKTGVLKILFTGSKALCPEAHRERSSTGERAYGYRLPPLKRCRELFEAAIQGKVDWDL